ncbi:MAG: 3-ketoacyl-CoA thiolase [Candidatus Micrarchaeota archaeon]|nr:MAG: 3-ketoacyl-CoA thiolase [Candidatus Micrarchaeota archaeon]
MQDVYIIDIGRTPIGKFGGLLKDISPVDLAASLLKELLRRSGIDKSKIDLTIIGNVLRAGHGQNIARQVAIKADVPYNADSFSLDMVCSSGMLSMINAYNFIKAGNADLVVAGGTESMSQAHFAIKHHIRWGVKMLNQSRLDIIDTMQYDGLTDPFNNKLMGVEADEIAKEFSIKREELDRVAYESHKRAAEATEKKLFKEIVPVAVGSSVVDKDEGIRYDTDMSKISALKPAFGENGLHTAATSSQISDGASIALLASERFIKENNIKAKAVIKAYEIVGVKPERFVYAPVESVRKLLRKIDKSIEDIAVFENNEAFAVSSALMNKELNIPYSKLNILGGAIAIGHPIGASGSRIVATLLSAMDKLNADNGIASICHGTGGATALYIERVR